MQKIAMRIIFFGILLPAFALEASQVVVHQFPVTPYVKKQMHFWEKVFAQHSTQQVLIHDPWNPDLIIDIIDFDAFSKKMNKGKAYTRAQKDLILSKYMQRYNQALKRFAEEGRAAIRHGAIEKRVYNVYSKDLKALSALYKGEIEIRSQTGLSDEFEQAAAVAEQYLPYMEKIFIREGVSSDLTRIAFVESMFNLNAKSKVGASGIWQFMPSTAKSYLRLNELVDERHSPLKATVAAARLLKDNYGALQAWPLAITAYNHGRSGMGRAQKLHKTNNMDEIILNYKSRSFGFASRNFYAEFLAAKNVYNSKFRHKRQNHRNPLSISMVRLDQPLTVSQIVRHTQLSVDQIKEHNPDFKEAAFTRYKDVPLPTNYELIIPYHLEASVKKSIHQLIAMNTQHDRKRNRL